MTSTLNRLPDDEAGYALDSAVLASVFAASRDCIAVFDSEGRLLFMSPMGRKLLQVTDWEALRHLSWEQFWPEQARDHARKAFAAAQAGGTGEFSAPREDFSGNPRFWDVHVSPIPDEDGGPGRVLVVMRDQTDAWRREQERHLLSAELNHRMKNQMAVVQSIVNQTLRGAYPLDTAKKMIATRLDVLARAHDLLMHSEGERAPLRALVDTATQLLDGRRVLVSGPDILLAPKSALSLSLILHELSSNAVAHGAHSAPDGRVEISWGHCDMDGAPAFELRFAESGGPPVAPPSVRGFGTRLLQGGLSGSASQANLDFHPDGVQFRLVAVLTSDQNTLG